MTGEREERAVEAAARFVLENSRRGNASLNGEQYAADTTELMKAYRDIITKAVASGHLAFSTQERDAGNQGEAGELAGRAIVAAEYRLHCSPHEWTDEDSEAMARYIIALHGPATSRMNLGDATPATDNAVLVERLEAIRAKVAVDAFDIDMRVAARGYIEAAEATYKLMPEILAALRSPSGEGG